MTRYFLDTTAHIERYAGESSVKARILELLGDESHSTSLHALREWKGIVEQGCLDILQALEDAEDFGTLFAKLGQGWGRQPNQRFRILSMCCAGERKASLSEIRIRAQSLLRQSERRFHWRIDRVASESGCGLAAENVLVDPRGRRRLKTQCRKAEAICSREAEIAASGVRMRAAAAALFATGDAGYRAAGDAANRAVDVPRDGKGRACYGVLGDISIALGCAADESVLATDAVFAVLAPAVGVAVEHVPATRL